MLGVDRRCPHWAVGGGPSPGACGISCLGLESCTPPALWRTMWLTSYTGRSKTVGLGLLELTFQALG